MDITSDFVYCRLHGSEELYRSGYDAAAIDRWAARVLDWSRGRPMRDVFLYFDNTDKLRATRRSGIDTAPWAGRRATRMRAEYPRSVPLFLIPLATAIMGPERASATP